MKIHSILGWSEDETDELEMSQGLSSVMKTFCRLSPIRYAFQQGLHCIISICFEMKCFFVSSASITSSLQSTTPKEALHFLLISQGEWRHDTRLGAQAATH